MSEIIPFIFLWICHFGGPDSALNDLGGFIETHTTGGSTISTEVLASGDVPEWLVADGFTPQALAVTYDVRAEGSAGIRFHLRSDRGEFLNAADYTYLVFLTRADSSAETFGIHLADTSTQGSGEEVFVGPIEQYLVGGMSPEWSQVRVPILEVGGAIDFAHLAAIDFVFNTPGKGRVYLDEICLVGVPQAQLDPAAMQSERPDRQPVSPPGLELIDDTQPPVNQPNNDARF